MTPGILAIFSLLGLVVSGVWVASQYGTEPGPTASLPQVGDVYSFCSEGRANSPTEIAKPYASLTEVLEVNGEWMKVRRYYFEVGGRSFTSLDEWEKRENSSVLQKLRSGPAKPQFEPGVASPLSSKEPAIQSAAGTGSAGELRVVPKPMIFECRENATEMVMIVSGFVTGEYKRPENASDVTVKLWTKDGREWQAQWVRKEQAEAAK